MNVVLENLKQPLAAQDDVVAAEDDAFTLCLRRACAARGLSVLGSFADLGKRLNDADGCNYSDFDEEEEQEQWEKDTGQSDLSEKTDADEYDRWLDEQQLLLYENRELGAQV